MAKKAQVVTINNGLVTRIQTFDDNGSGYISHIGLETDFMGQVKALHPNWHLITDHEMSMAIEEGFLEYAPNSSVQVHWSE